MPTISSNDKVLVTGANGYIGLWVVRYLLEHGYLIRAAVRSDDKGKALQDIFQQKLPAKVANLEYVLVKDIAAEHAFDDAVKGVAAIVHIASPLTIEIEDPQEVIGPAVGGTLSLLNSALAYGTDLKRIVITSSVKAVLGPEARTYTEDDWSEFAVKEVEEKGKAADKMSMYCASKFLAERAAWKFVEEHKPSWDLTVLNVAWVYGPTVNDPVSPAAIPSTAGLFFQQFFTVRDAAYSYPPAQNYIDIRDVADAFIKALEVDAAGGERIIVTSEWSTWQHWLNAAADMNLLPKLDKWDPKRVEGLSPRIASNEKAKRILGLTFRTISETLTDILDDFRPRGWLKEWEA
ncbi:NAD(P)-binding protein [Lentinus tigrinus ALCF2SS1-7]|uniref:NAD(P)-binding protein n=1 Tax=Lentinus tigrinus ALCF2SS1-6 TaxID=1328759 RepID=A0A5C2RQB5_9APHY|nr:NAD(P)-binding protein [Lentinus tigrinus ALCF2SS1-6]RPD68698.1 NAD(P)-binding protein [Lentinus tigrinus ALCF2SS1-7]